MLRLLRFWMGSPAGIIRQARRIAAGSDLNSIDFSAQGVVWRHEIDTNGVVDEWCDTTTPPTATNASPDTTAKCIAKKITCEWSYDNHQSSSGTAGVTCNSTLRFRNLGLEPLRLVLYEHWDTDAMNSAGWEDYSVAVGLEWEKHISKRLYFSGIMTFERVERMLVIRELPGCVNNLPGDNTGAEWEAAAEYIDDIPCPWDAAGLVEKSLPPGSGGRLV